MKPTDRYKMWIKRWEGWLEQKPESEALKKLLKEAKSDLKQWRKERNDNTDYIQFHRAYIKVGSNNKDAGWDNWKKFVVDRDVDPEVVIKSVPAYFADCKKTDTSILNGERFLSGSRWEKYEGVKDRVVKKRMCTKCGKFPAKHQHSWRDEKKAWWSGNICDKCKTDLDNVIISSSETIKPVTQAERPLAGGTDDTNQAGGSLSPVNTKQRIDNAMNKYGMQFKEK